MKKALVTGASSGIGAEIAKILSDKGYYVILVARRKEKLEEVKAQLKECEIFVADLSKSDAVESVFEKHRDIDVLVNNAGFGVFGEFDKTDFARESEMIDLNIKALHHLTKLYLSEFKSKGSGKILNVASTAAFFPGPKFSSYYASKAYVYRLSIALCEELRREKSPITLSVFCPGPVRTEFNDVAGVKFGINSISAQYAAKIAVDGMLKGKTVIVPSFLIKATRFFSKLIPDRILARIVYYLQTYKSR